MRRRTLAMGLTIALAICTSVMLLVQAGPQTAGVDLGPDRSQQAKPGENITYDHVLTNTGTATDTFSVDVLSTQGWPAGLTSETYPTETQVLTLELGPQISTALQVTLTVPSYARGVTEATLVTATSQLSPTVQDTAIDTTHVPATVYLPLLMRRWPPLPYQPTLHSISNPDGDGSYAVSWTEQPTRHADVYVLQEATNITFTSDVRQACRTTAQSCNVTSWPAGTYYYRVRGHNTWGDGPYSEVQSVTVLPPATPVINPIANGDRDGTYTVTWSATARTTQYQLQRDTDPEFQSAQTVYQGAESSWSETSNQAGTSHFRVQALGPTGQSEWSGPQSVTVVATPHNPRAQDIVLALSDMPSGYALNQDESGPLDPGEAAADAYQVWYENPDLRFWGTPIVANISVVFKTTHAARGHVQRADQEFGADPEYSPVSCRTLGDEAIAYRQVTEEDGIELVAHLILFRKDNLTALVLTGGLLGTGEFGTTRPFAQTVLDKINSQIAASHPSEDASRPRQVVDATV
jgi:uncharacterized repeat protein (TIGR01451 family)